MNWRRRAASGAVLLAIALGTTQVISYGVDGELEPSPYGVAKKTVGDVTGEISWGDYEYFETSMEHNEDAWGTDDWGGRLNLSLRRLEYNGYTDCTNEGGKKVWVEDGGTCSLSLDDDTEHVTTFKCYGQCAGEGGCDFEYESKVFGHWKGDYEGIDAKLVAAGSFTALCMAHVPHNVNLTLASGDGQTTITDTLSITAEGGQTFTGEAEAGGTVKGIPVKAMRGHKVTEAASVTREVVITTKTTSATIWDRTYLVLTDWETSMKVNQDPIRRVRSLSWSWTQNYNAFMVDPDGTPTDTQIRRGNTQKARWEISTPSYKIMPWCGAKPADQGYNPVGEPSDTPEIPGKNIKRDALVYVPEAKDGEPFQITIDVANPEVLSLTALGVEETGIVEDFDAIVAEFDPTIGHAVVTSSVPFVLRLEVLGNDYGTGVLALTREGGMPDSGEQEPLEPYLELAIDVINRGFIVAEVEGWPSGDLRATDVSPIGVIHVTMSTGTSLGLTLDTGAEQEDNLQLTVVTDGIGVIEYLAPEAVFAGEQSAIIWFRTEQVTEGESFFVNLNGRTIEIRITSTPPQTGDGNESQDAVLSSFDRAVTIDTVPFSSWGSLSLNR